MGGLKKIFKNQKPLAHEFFSIFLANKNQMTFCKLLKITKELPGKNIDLKSSDLVSLMSRENYSCNKNNLLTYFN